MTWTTPAEIVDRVLRRWDRGDILGARITGEHLFPLELRLKGPSPGDITNHFGDVQDWARVLTEAEERDGFKLRRKTTRNRVQGTNQIPAAVVIETETDALCLIRRQKEADRFQTLAETTLSRFPALRPWLARRALALLDHAAHWEQVLAVLDRFATYPRPNLYIRQLDIPGVDTKFIEGHRRLIAELLDEILPENAIDDSAMGVKGFNQRYGLRTEPPLVRFRLLDPSLDLCGLIDISLPPEQFASLKLNVRRVFITENRTNGLTFPDCPHSLVVFGLGYGLDRLARIDWLAGVNIHYWGDLDTHGFGILDRLRAIIPHTRSFLMDRETLDDHRTLWGQEHLDKRYIGEPTRLTSPELDLFNDLRHDRLGDRIRLEQEQIGYSWLEQALEAIT
jgi:hypothetical protein